MRTKAVLAMLVGAVGLAACNDSDFVAFVPVVNNTLIGTFALRTVLGNRVPTAVLDSALSPDTVIVQSGAITINTDNTFSDVVAFQEVLNGVTLQRTISCRGTYSRDATVFTFTEILEIPNCGRIFTGVVTGQVLSASIKGGIPAQYSTQPLITP